MTRGSGTLLVMALLGSLGLLLLPAACTDKADDGDTGGPRDCPSYNGVPCAEAGIPDERQAALCDECDNLWVCYERVDGPNTMRAVGVPCSCINDEGFVEYVKHTACDPYSDEGD